MKTPSVRRVFVFAASILLLIALTGCGNQSVEEDSSLGEDPIIPGGHVPADDLVPPVVVSTQPADGSTDIMLNMIIKAEFSEVLDTSTIGTDTFRLSNNSGEIQGTVAYNDVTATFTPSANLNPSTIYTARLTTDIKDITGNPMAGEKSWTFTTGTPADTSAPGSPSVSINSDSATTNSVSITLSLSATDDIGVVGYFISETNSTPQPGDNGWNSVSSTTNTTNYSADVDYTLSSGDGTKTVYVWFKDTYGNVSSMASDSITLDTSDHTAPSSPAVNINNGDSTTDSVTVTLNLSASDNVGVTAYYLSENNSTPSAGATGWTSVTSALNYSSSISFTLSTGDGNKTVYVWFKDSAGNVSGTVSDSIELITIDSSAPTNPSITINNNSTTTSSTSVTLNISANDDIGVAAYYASENNSTPSASAGGWISVNVSTTYSDSVNFTLSSSDGTKTVYVWFKDAAGNISAPVSDTITLSTPDTTAPTSPSVSINGGAASTTSASVTLTLSASDNVGVTAYYASESSTTPSQSDSGWISVTSATNYSGSVLFTLTSGAGTKNVNVWFKDQAGNISGMTSDSISLIADSTWSAGDNPSNIYIKFNGGDNRIEVSADSNLYAANALSIEGYLKINDSSGVGHYYVFYIFNTLAVYVSNTEITFALYSGGWTNLSSTKPNDGIWFHFAGTWDGSTLRMFINGNLVQSTPFSGPVTDNNQIFIMGNYYNFAAGFDGYVDEIRISNIVRYTSNFSPQKDLITDSNTIGLWHFDEDDYSTSIAANSVTSGNDGSITGASWMNIADTTAPTLSEVTGVSTPINNSTPTYTFSSDEAGTISYGGDCSSSTTSAIAGNNTIPFNALSDGAHSNCTITVTDSSSNASTPLSVSSFTVDTVAPSTPSVNGTTPTNDTTPTWSWTSGGGGNGNYRYKLDDSNLTSGATQNNVTTYTPSSALSEATHTLYVQERDDAGNWSSSGSKSIVIDITAPSLTETSAVTSPTNDSTPNYTFNTNEAGTITYGGSCSSSTTSAGSGDNTITLNTLSDGIYSDCTITVTDSAGNASSALNISSFTVDTTAPTLTQVTPVSTPTTDNTPNYTFNSNEAGTITYGGSCSSTTTNAGVGDNTITFNSLSDGTYSNCTITVTDSAGNTSSTLNISTFEVDTSGGGDSTAPTNTSIMINSGASSTNSTSVIITLSATDVAGVTAYYASESSTAPSSSDGGWIDVTSDTSYSGSATYTLNAGDGTKTVYVWFKDAAGNVSSGSNDSILLSSQAQTFNPADGLVAYYPFNGNANDESGNGNDGTVNGATLTLDRIGNAEKAYTFEAGNKNIEIAHADALNPNDLSISVWVKFVGIYNGSSNVIINKSNWPADSGYFISYYDSVGCGGSSDCGIFFSVNDDVYRHNSGYHPNIGEYTHIVVTYKRNEGKTEIYINGVSKGTKTGAPNMGSSTEPLIIGKNPINTIYGTNGVIDDIRIYNRVLSDTEIEALYAQESGMVLINGGTFQMGDLSELPVHTVTLSDFYISDHEVTATEYEECVDSGGCTYSGSGSYETYNQSGYENHPMNYVSWNETQDYILWKNQYSGITYRLCSESEWEYTARAGTTTNYSCGDSDSCLNDVAWWSGNNTPGGPKEVKTKKANAWGLYDMHGNLWEWVQDWYHSSYTGAPSDGSAWETPAGTNRVVRGGAFYTTASDSQSAHRDGANSPAVRYGYIGFRLCAVKSKLPDTGQTTSYTDTFGEDHDYTINPPNYTAIDIGNDSNTSNDIVIDNNTGLIWQREDDNTTRTWADASTDCVNKTLAGYDDWRLPGLWELFSITNYSSSSLSIDTSIFMNTKSSYYWSSITDNTYTDKAWTINFGGAWKYSYNKDNSTYVRCVRRGIESDIWVPDFTSNVDGTVTDNKTHLIWQKEHGLQKNWTEALDYCENLNLAGQTDWRLPNILEFIFMAWDLTIYQTYFPNSGICYWSSTTKPYNPEQAFFGAVTESNYATNNPNKESISTSVRCVRGGQN